MFTKKMFPQGFASITGFLIIALIMVASQSISGAIAVQAENVTQEQKMALEKQKEVALAREAAIEAAALEKQAEENRVKAMEARKAVLKGTGTSFDIEGISESTQNLAERITASTPLDFRTALAVAVYSRQFNLRPSFLLAVISKESNFHQFSVGSHNDRGYMQIIPSTERFMMRAYGEQLGLKYNPKQIFDPEYNLGLGAAYLGAMIDAYGDVHRALTEYNRGEGGAHKYFQKNRTYSTSYSKSILKLEQQYLDLN